MSPTTALWQEAAAFAARAHRHQLRKDGRTPYVSHVFRVCLTVRHVFGCDDHTVLLAALLHDTIEDTTTDYDDLAERFGDAVAQTVAALTKDMTLPEAPREAEYDRRLAAADWRARLVKLADVYDNLLDTATYPESQRATKLAENLGRCERALSLARVDADRPDTARAVAALRVLMSDTAR